MDDGSNSKNQQTKPPQALERPKSTSSSSHQVLSKKKASRPLLQGGIVGVIVLTVAAVGAVLSMTIFGNPGKSDYKDMQRKGGGYEGVVNKTDEFYAKIDSCKTLKDKEVKDVYDKYLKIWNDEAILCASRSIQARLYLQKYGHAPTLPPTASLRPYFGDYEIDKKLEDRFDSFKRILKEKSKQSMFKDKAPREIRVLYLTIVKLQRYNVKKYKSQENIIYG